MNHELMQKLQRKLAVTVPRSEVRALAGAEHNPALSVGMESEDERCAEGRDLGPPDQHDRIRATR